MSVPWYLMAKGKGGGGYKTASGPIVSVNDALAAPLRSLVANIEPVQDLHGYDSPWPAGGGKNKFDVDKMVNTADITISNGIITVTGNSKNSTKKLGELADLDVGEAYILTANTTGTENLIYLYGTGANVSWLFGTSKTITQEMLNALVFFYGGSGTTSQISDFMIRLSSVSDATYAPYSNICPITGWSEVNVWVKPTHDTASDPTATLQLGQTVYGGTLDVTNGKMVVDRGMKVFNGDSSEGWAKTEYNYFVTSEISDAIVRNATPSDFQSNLFPYGNISNGSSTLGACLIWGTIRVRLADMSISLDDWKAQLASTPMQVVYSLATPITIPLTPTQISTLLGQNNVWADSGDVTIEYLASGGANADLMKLAVAFMGKEVKQ